MFTLMAKKANKPTGRPEAGATTPGYSLPYRNATADDLAEVVRIYNAAIPGRQATADVEPLTVADRIAWFQAHSPNHRPIWVVDDFGGYQSLRAWLSFSDFYGRAAYSATSEVSVYVDPGAHRQGLARGLLSAAIIAAPSLGIDTLLGFIFDHNEPSLSLFRSFGFERWAHLPRVATLDGVERGLVIAGLRVTP